MEAKKLGRRANYAPTVGAEHCPTCWVRAGAVNRLRIEPRHNVDSVLCVVCDRCGFYSAI